MQVNLATETGSVVFDQDIVSKRTILETIKNLGFEAEVLAAADENLLVKQQRGNQGEANQDEEGADSGFRLCLGPSDPFHG